MSLSQEDLVQVLELFAASDWDELDVISGDIRVAVSKHGNGTFTPLVRGGSTAAPAPPSAASPVAGPAVAARAVTTAPPAVTTAPPDGGPADDEPPPGVVGVRAPTLGTFYVAGKPGAPPFVQPGDVVGPEDTLAIVEVMKLMNPVKAGVAGEVVKVCARNSELVEYDRVLFWIRPTDGQA
jgi:acetyl-CoA carboxylase biotin carboxyl carrier protein